MTPPPLSELCDLLRADGFPIGVDHHVRMGRLLACEAAWTPEMLRIAIAALVITEPSQRKAFDACWERWLQNVEPPRRVESARREPPPPRQRSLGRIAGIAGAIAILAMVVLNVQHGAGHEPGGVISQKSVGDGASSPGSGAPPTSTASPPVADQPARPSVGTLLSLLALTAGGALLVVATLAAARGAIARRRFVPGPWRYALAVPPAIQPVLPRIAIEYAAADLTWFGPEADPELDLARTVAATVANGGLPTPVHRRAPAAPHYVVLEDTAAGAERWRFMYDELLRGLAGEGFGVERYTFAGSPDRCTGPDGRIVALGALLDHTEALIVIGDGDPAVNALTGERAAWLVTLLHVPKRLWINPLPPARWSAGAHAIAVDTPMEHGVARAIAAVRVGVDRQVRPDHVYPAVIERTPGTVSAMVALREALGPRAFRLVAALSIIGPPSIPLARWIAEKYALELRERDWLGVVTLPWFRTAQWPAGMCERLRAELARDDHELVRSLTATSDALLAASEPPRSSGAHLAWQIEGARRAWLRGERRGAARALNRITATPLAHQARGELAALGLVDRTRAVLALVFAAGVLVVATAGYLVTAPGKPGPIARCAVLVRQRSWQTAKACADQLDDSPEARALRDEAQRGEKSDADADAVRQALRAGNLQAAEALLVQIGSDSIYRAELRDAFDKAEAQVLAAVTRTAQQYADGHDCTRLQTYRDQVIPGATQRIAAAVRAIPCEGIPGNAPVRPAIALNSPGAGGGSSGTGAGSSGTGPGSALTRPSSPARPPAVSPVQGPRIVVAPSQTERHAAAMGSASSRDAPAARLIQSVASRDSTSCDQLDVDDVQQQARASYEAGNARGALTEVAKAISCRLGGSNMFSLATGYACSAHEPTEARRYFAGVPADARSRILNSCMRIGVDPRDPPCDSFSVDDVMDQAQNQYRAGAFREALKLAVQALTCRQNSRMYQSAAMYACAAHDLPHAKEYFAQLPANLQSNVEQRCLQEGLQLR